MANCKICNDTGKDPGIYNESNPNSSDTWQGGGRCSCPAGKRWNGRSPGGRSKANDGCMASVLFLITMTSLMIITIVSLIKI